MAVASAPLLTFDPRGQWYLHMDRNKPPLIGVVGGIASGKSYVAEQLQHQGAVVISADRLAHEVLRQGDVKQAVRAVGRCRFVRRRRSGS